MTSLNFISFLSRAHFSTYTYYSRCVLKNTIDSPLSKVLISRFYVSTSKIALLKPDIKSVSLCLPKPQYKSIKVQVFCLKHTVSTFEQLRYFRTSERRYLNPAVWIILRPVFKLLALITGRAFRKWWKDLPPNKKKYFMGVIKENRHKIVLFAITSVTLSVMYYVSHIEETPLTKRKRFIAFNSKQLEKINEFELQQIAAKYQNHALPPNHPYCARVKAVVDRILNANHELKEVQGKKWNIAVINNSVENAFVLPIGFVFVFTGMLQLCSSDEELAVVLSHEIAHSILNHGAENASFVHLLDLISIVIIGAIWAIVPSDSLSLLTHWLYQKMLQILFELPYNRKVETEADVVGLILAAKACFDVRESSAFWAKMAVFHRSMGRGPEIEFLSTHPSHENRSEYLDSVMHEAITFRDECGCPKLKARDPRTNLEVVTKALEAARLKYLQQHPKPAIQFHI